MSDMNDIGRDDTTEQEYIYFKEGLFGFETCRKFLPVLVEEKSDAVLTLHSLDREEISFVLMNPFYLLEEYDPQVSQQELAELGEVEGAEYSWYVICTTRNPIEESTVNLKCPIVVNVHTRRARQVILEDKTYQFRHRLKDLRREADGC